MISAKKPTLLKSGWHTICGWSNILVRNSDITILIIAVRIIKKYLNDKKTCEEDNMKCSQKNKLKGHIIHSNQINTWNVNSKYHTTKDQIKCHMKIHTMQNPYHCFLCAKMPSQGAALRVMLVKIWICMHCVKGKSYQGTTQRDAVKGLLSSIYITVVCVAKDLYLGTTQKDTWRFLLYRINISVWQKNC